MAAKSKKRLSKIENKLLILDKLELKDVYCSICQSILIEPVTLPCSHDFCHHCFNGSIENNALCCPLCRLRIGSWLRTATKQKNLVNVDLWKFIQSKFAQEVEKKLRGEDISLPDERPILRLSAPGEIRSEYEAELKRLRQERQKLEEKHLDETEILIKKIQEEEEEAHKRYVEILKQDEILALQMKNEQLKLAVPPNSPNAQKKSIKHKKRLKVTKIDSFLTKPHTTKIKESPLLTDDASSSNRSETPILSTDKIENGGSPEMVPTYSKFLKNLIEKKNKVGLGLWNKENGESLNKEKDTPKLVHKETSKTEVKQKNKPVVPSLLVSLPLPHSGILHKKFNPSEKRIVETGSADSMRQELCFFKPIDRASPTSCTINKELPLRVPGVRPAAGHAPPARGAPPTRAQHITSLCQLRETSLARHLSSAFVIALNILRATNVTRASPKNLRETRTNPCQKSISSKCDTTSKEPTASPSPLARRQPFRTKVSRADGVSKRDDAATNLRRTRSMGSISKDENETTPKKAKIKQRKAASDRKPRLRSDSRKQPRKPSLALDAPPPNAERVERAARNLSSPLKNCDVKKILNEQLRIEEIIEQERSDFELARRLEAEWNGRRPRRAALKRPRPAPAPALRPAKKLKV